MRQALGLDPYSLLSDGTIPDDVLVGLWDACAEVTLDASTDDLLQLEPDTRDRVHDAFGWLHTYIRQQPGAAELDTAADYIDRIMAGTA